MPHRIQKPVKFRTSEKERREQRRRFRNEVNTIRRNLRSTKTSDLVEMIAQHVHNGFGGLARVTAAKELLDDRIPVDPLPGGQN